MKILFEDERKLEGLKKSLIKILSEIGQEKDVDNFYEHVAECFPQANWKPVEVQLLRNALSNFSSGR